MKAKGSTQKPSYDSWLQYAGDDLKAAKKLIEGDDIVLSSAFFHMQQCAEKALKGFLAFKGEPILKIHDLRMLLNLCKKFDREFEILENEASNLNPYITETRYPDGISIIPDFTTAKLSIVEAEKILEFVKRKII